VNDKAKDEASAHMSMFYPKDNPGFYSMATKARSLIEEWVDQGWYESSELNKDGSSVGGHTYGEVGDGWEKPDHESEEAQAKERQKEAVDVDADGVPQGWEGVDGTKDLDDEVEMMDEWAWAKAQKKRQSGGGNSVPGHEAKGRPPGISNTIEGDNPWAKADEDDDQEKLGDSIIVDMAAGTPLPP